MHEKGGLKGLRQYSDEMRENEGAEAGTIVQYSSVNIKHQNMRIPLHVQTMHENSNDCNRLENTVHKYVLVSRVYFIFLTGLLIPGRSELC